MSISGVVKAGAKTALRAAGFRCLREGSLPRGLDPLVDLRAIVGHRLGTVVDVGANIGQFCARVLQENAATKVVACEPVPATFAELRGNITESTNTILEPVALGATSGAATMQVFGPTSEMNRVVDGAASAGGDRISVPIITLDELLGRHSLTRVDLLKIDTEGYELEVLRGGGVAIGNGVVRSVLAECCFTEHDTHHTYFFPLYEWLSAHGYRFLGLYDVHHLAGSLHYCNALFVFGGGSAPPHHP